MELSKRIEKAREELDMFGTSPTVEDLLDWMIEAQLLERKMSGHDGHFSDCATHNEPAYPNGPCDCGGNAPLTPNT